MAEAEEVSPLVRDARQLQMDVIEGAKTLRGITDVGDLVKHLTDTLWPTLEALADQAVANAVDNDELDNAVIELAEGEGEMLTPETAGIFANMILSAREIADELEKRLLANDTPIKAKVKAFRALLDAGEAQLEELTVGDGDDDDDDETEGDK
jgi:hypothetical protein